MPRTANFAKDIEKEAAGEIIACVIGAGSSWGDYGLEDMEPRPPAELCGVPLTWTLARPWLDRDYDDGFGSPGCVAIYAWTDEKVIFVSCYDGSTWVVSVPRNPTDGQPRMPGGG